MTTARKIIALLIIVLFGIPILFGVIWLVGLTKATVSPEFLTDLPREIIADIPEMAEEIFTEAQSERVITDANTRAWFRAAAEAGVTPRQVMEETGLQNWLHNELSESLGEVGEVLRGKRRARTIVLDLRPLKKILLRDDINRYMMKILEHLPPCDEEGIRTWMAIAKEDWVDARLPACRPDLDIAQEVLKYKRTEAVNEMEEEIEILEDVRFIPFGISRAVTWLSSFLFLIPAFFIFIGALIAATSPASFFRWSGVSILVGAIPALLLSLFVKSASLWALNFVPYSYSDAWSSELSDLVLEKTSWIPATIIDHLFSPVAEVSGIVCAIGLVIFVISFMVRGQIRTKVVYRQTAPPAPEALEKADQAEEKQEEKEAEGTEALDKEPKELKAGSAESDETGEPEAESGDSNKKEE
jgi:hypothetical protein